MSDLPLLDWQPPVERNYKRAGTSSRAAHSAAKYAGKTFLAILEALSERPMTPDEVAQATGINLLTVRPRMSDLANPRDPDGFRTIAPFITATGTERSTDAGKAASVMRLTTTDERREWRANAS